MTDQPLQTEEELHNAIYDLAVCNVQDTETGEEMYAIPPVKLINYIAQRDAQWQARLEQAVNEARLNEAI